MRIQLHAATVGFLLFLLGCAPQQVAQKDPHPSAVIRQATCRLCGKPLDASVQGSGDASGLCAACREKERTREQQSQRQAKIDSFSNFLGPILVKRETDRSGQIREYVIYVDWIYSERKRVPMSVVLGLKHSYDFNCSKYGVKGSLRLSDFYAPSTAPKLWLTGVNVTNVIGGTDYADAFLANTTSSPIHRAVVVIHYYEGSKLKGTSNVDFLKDRVLPPRTLDRFRVHLKALGNRYTYDLARQ